MDEDIQHALARDRTINITTRGRKTGQLRRIEIWFHQIDGHVYITGTPGHRDACLLQCSSSCLATANESLQGV